MSRTWCSYVLCFDKWTVFDRSKRLIVEEKMHPSSSAYGGLIHDYHHHHDLMLEYDEMPFRCYGCLEAGFGHRYTCVEQCGHVLHMDCANPKATLAHPFFPDCVFLFLVSSEKDCRCDACGASIDGYVYHCFDKGKNLHPCCANLKHRLPVETEEGTMTLVLRHKSSSKCYKCGKKHLIKGANSWMYVSESEEHHFHVSCVKNNMLEILDDFILGGKGAAPNLEANEIRALDKGLHKLSVARGKDSGNKGKFAKLKKIVKIAITVVMAAVFGDPTALVAAVIANLIIHWKG